MLQILHECSLMSLRIDPQKPVTSPTVGYEGELRAIRFILIKNDKKQMEVVKGDEVLSVFYPTKNRVECVIDNSGVDSDLFAQLEKIAEERNLSISDSCKLTSHIFEFVTLPASTTEEIKVQFEEIARIEQHLLRYLFAQKISDQNKKLVCVKDWIDDYNKSCFPNEPLQSSDNASEMHIVLDYSLKQLQLNNQQQSVLDNFPNNENLQKLSEELQPTLLHNPQFNFVASLGKKMGTLLVDMQQENNINIKHCRNTQITKLLLHAQTNAEKACQLINSIYSEEKKEEEDKSVWKKATSLKMAKVEGFFFILAMRILTETTFIKIDSRETDKNKYPFFVKTQLSDLIFSLSETDKRLLASINTAWTDAQKLKLLASISGSFEALAVYYQIGKEFFTVKNMLESVLGWRKDSDKICNKFPNNSIKTFKPPYEPIMPGWRSKQHQDALRWVLLEQRLVMFRTLVASEKTMYRLLEQTNEFFKPTHKQKQYWQGWGEDAALQYMGNPEVSTHLKYEFKEGIKLYHPSLYYCHFFQKLQREHSKQLAELNKFQQDIDAVKQGFEQDTVFAENNIKMAIKIIEISSIENLKNTLQSGFFHKDADIYLKQLNHLFILIKSNKVISKERIISIQKQLIELYSEKIFSLFQVPLKDGEDAYIRYLCSRYIITKAAPALKDFFNFLLKNNAKQNEKVAGSAVSLKRLRS